MENVNHGFIEGFGGSWGSGIGFLRIRDAESNKIVSVPCENGHTVRALDAAYGDVISSGHTVDSEALNGKEIWWIWDDLGMMLGGFSPEEPDLVEEYC